MSNLVSAGIGDHLCLVYHPRIFQVTQPGHPSLGRCNEYRQWFWPPLRKKRRVLRSSKPCDQDRWHIGWSRWKTMTVDLSRQSERYSLYASLTGSNPRRLNSAKGDELPRDGHYSTRYIVGPLHPKICFRLAEPRTPDKFTLDFQW